MTGNGCLSPGSIYSPILVKSKEKYANIHINQTKKNKYKEKILKAAGENQQTMYKEIFIMLPSNFSAETLQVRREWWDIFKVIKEESLQPRILYPARISFRFDGEIERVTDKQI